MNKLTRSIVLGTALIASLASSIEIASAGDREWRNRGFHNHQGWRHNNGVRFRNRALAAGVLGVTAGVVVGSMLSEPRVVYRERPLYRPDVVVDEGPVYDDPDVEYVGPIDGEYADDYDRPGDRRNQRQMDEQAQDDGYFPDRPQKHNQQRNTDIAQQGTIEPWTAQWRTYCKQRFASFNAATGTYKGYDGKSHFCTAG